MVSLSIASATRMPSLSNTGGRPPLRPRFRAAVANHSVISWGHIRERIETLALFCGQASVSRCHSQRQSDVSDDRTDAGKVSATARAAPKLLSLHSPEREH